MEEPRKSKPKRDAERIVGDMFLRTAEERWDSITVILGLRKLCAKKKGKKFCLMNLEEVTSREVANRLKIMARISTTIDMAYQMGKIPAEVSVGKSTIHMVFEVIVAKVKGNECVTLRKEISRKARNQNRKPPL
ncbi:MAG: hypothetical protein HQ402_03550 [Parcubacteria group bacterium]|nr:hypothetical protein [Parcubacteria group bacterium]